MATDKNDLGKTIENKDLIDDCKKASTEEENYRDKKLIEAAEAVVSFDRAHEEPLAENQFFFEDEVFRIDKRGRVRFGLVIETTETYDESEVDDEVYDEILNKGEVRISWYPDDREYVHHETKIGLADRTLMPGDVVRRLVPGKETQRGYIREMDMRVDVRVLGTKYVIKNVIAERLRMMGSWQRDTAVCLDSWVGSTKNIEDRAVLVNSSGARIAVSSKDYYYFKEMQRTSGSGNSIFIFYPGNTVVGRLPSLERAIVLTPNLLPRLNKKGKPLQDTYIVESTYTHAVWVNWQCKALSEDPASQNNPLQQPNSCVTGEDLHRLKRLNLFDSYVIQINDRAFLKYSQLDAVTKYSEWEKKMAEKYEDILYQQKFKYKRKLVDGNESVNVQSKKTRRKSLLDVEMKKMRMLCNSEEDSDSKKTKMEESAADESTRKGSDNKEKINGGSKVENRDEETEKENVVQRTEKKKDKKETEDETDIKDAVPSKISNHSTNLSSVGIRMPRIKNSHSGTKKSRTHKTHASDWATDNSDDEDDTADEMLDNDAESPSNCPNAAILNGDESIGTSSNLSVRCNNQKVLHRNRKSKKKMHLKQSKKPLMNMFAVPPKYKPVEGDELATQALLTQSTATVVWQDGSIEHGIPSTDLYPIHHLDNHEFFPGDFVISNDSDVSYRDYGVIQVVDHHGRTARVKWFTTYASAEEPRPSYNGETECSVYDLRDHPDFQYRPGTMVIRVANFVGEDVNCTAGQIIDNFIEGRIKVWWVDNHISMCWPQDLFEVGQFDQPEWEEDSEASWETESENSELGGDTTPKQTVAESHILSNIERARVAIARLEEIFNLSPLLQNAEVMKKLMSVYKGCRYLDRMLSTNFFHEKHFMGLVDRVRKGGTQSISERAQDRKNRLFNNASNQSKVEQTEENALSPTNPTGAILSEVIYSKSSTPLKVTANNLTGADKQEETVATKMYKIGMAVLNPIAKIVSSTTSKLSKTNSNVAGVELSGSTENTAKTDPSLAESGVNSDNSYNTEKIQLLNSVIENIEAACEKREQLMRSFSNGSKDQHDSGNYSRCDNCDISIASSIEVGNNDLNVTTDERKSFSCSSIEINEDQARCTNVCINLCTLLKEQLGKCISDVRNKYYKSDNLNLSEIFDFETCDTNGSETVIELVDELKDDESEILEKVDSEIARRELALPNAENIKDSEVDQICMELNEKSNCVESPKSPTSIDISNIQVPTESFQVLPNAPKTHKFHLTIFHPSNTKQYYRAIQKEHRLLRSSLPAGVWVRVYEDRMDLLSVMIEGPKKTPYEDGLFFFDIQLGRDYPQSPPLCHYISYCTDRLNPNLYEDGKVCVSLLGTWTGRDTEMWCISSTLLQVIVSIQGLILVPEPYFNEAGYEKQKFTQQGQENSRMYNEMVVIKVVQATTKMLQQPPSIFANEIFDYYQKHATPLYDRVKGWAELSNDMLSKLNEEGKSSEESRTAECLTIYGKPDFSLLPASRGFCLTLDGALEAFKKKAANMSPPTLKTPEGAPVVDKDML